MMIESKTEKEKTNEEELSLKVQNLLKARKKLINKALSEPKQVKVIPDTDVC